MILGYLYDFDFSDESFLSISIELIRKEIGTCSRFLVSGSFVLFSHFSCGWNIKYQRRIPYLTSSLTSTKTLSLTKVETIMNTSIISLT